ncbi:CusA/CzcA family heavy metal efflux RND transporter [Mitsuaria sp. WAJ17]|uniref:CusA/CzcA family heavy metal efflux RND transporter n=1 Tax=Mitsuaria sp. WAJ17 TaxID=2761452 RepID=UPI0016027B7F|nr:CusA/CzcA family heavy metal efflux RND transporter [Mitsuaria sp. WAJ17]MBB2484372.1 CusA/CzcA family heavy metal efflux RND transporter [Mitsuaria sp. WAJ17]
MFERIIRFCIEQRWLVMLAVLGMAGLGVFSYTRLPVDAVADISNIQVVVNTQAPGYSPLETEQRVSYPIETLMSGLPGLEQTRSLSRYGLSQVTVIFKDGTDLHFARQLVNQRMQEARDRLPAGVTPSMGPISTGLGEIYLWTVEAAPDARKADGSPYTPTDLREIQDWVVKPQLRNVAGVAEINSIGGFEKQYVVAPDLERLAAHGLSLADVVKALEMNNASQGAGYIERKGEQYLVRAPGQVRSVDDIRDVIIGTAQGQAIRVRDIGEVALGRELRTGAATENGQEVVLGTVFMLMGENSRQVSRAVDRQMEAINKTLPAGVKAVTVYDRTTLVDKAVRTVQKNLIEGAALVVAVLFLFLGNIRAALITAMVIPLAMLFTFSGMVKAGISANLMSLGALDFGIIVDGAVVIVENCMRRLAHAQAHKGRTLTRGERLHEVFAAARESRRPLLYGQLIIMVVYVPILALTGVEGKMFHPMAFTVLLALLGALLLSVTFVPAAVALFMGDRVAEQENALMQWAGRRYQPLLARSLAHAPVVLTMAAVLVAFCGAVATRLGSEFVPNLNEGDLALQALRIPGTSLTQSVEMQRQLETQLKARFPEIERIFARTGTAEIAADPMPPNISDGYIMLKPQDEWPEPRRTREELLAAIREEAGKVPGSSYEFSQPIQLRFNELISGVRSDVAVKVFGDDQQVLGDTAGRIAQLLQAVPGATEVKVEQTTGLPMLTVNVDRTRTSRYGLSLGEVQDAVATAIGGREAGTVFQGDRRFGLLVRLPDAQRENLEALRRLPVPLPRGRGEERTSYVPLAELATLDLAPGPNQVSRENGKRRVVVSANVRGRDLGSFVEEAQALIEQKIKIPAGYWTRWGGTFEQLQSATRRLQLVVPLSLLMVFVLLFAMFGKVRDGLLVFTGIPFALTGGVLALWMRGIPLSISAAVGFIALSGVAVLNGLVMLSFIRSLREEGRSLDEAVREGALTRLRPVLMTALVASLGFVPMALATGTGAEVQRPLATVVIGGILSSTALTLLVLPILYRWAHGKDDGLETAEAVPKGGERLSPSALLSGSTLR